MISVRNVLAWYTRLLAWGGGALWLTVVAGNQSWLDHPWVVVILVLAVVGLRAGQIPLSKYSYLTQIGVPVLAGALTAGPTMVVLALGIGVFAADGVILKKPTWVAWINSGREVLAFIAAFGAYAFVLHLTGSSGVSIEYLPAAMALAGMYFFAARSLFYFTLLIRGKLEHDERLMLLRYEILAYLLTIIAVVIAVGAVMTLAPAGWAAVLMVLAVLGLLTKRILEEAIAAEELNKIHLRERVITSNVTLADTFRQMEELAHRVLDWSDFRIYRVRGEVFEAIYRGTHGRVGRGQPPADGPALRLQAVRERRPVVVEDARRDRRILAPDEHALSMMYVPLRFGDDTVGVLELDHHKNREYGPKAVAAASTFASQLATAMHIADLRAPLVETVERISLQVRSLAETTERLRSSASAAAVAAQNIRTGAGEQERFVAGGQEASAALASAAAGVATDGADVARVAHEAGEVAASNRDVIRDAIGRLVELKRFVAESSAQVAELNRVSERLVGFIGTIREIADLTNLISLNAAIEAARAGQQGKGFGVVAAEVRQLATQSAQASREASTLVATIQDQVASIGSHMNRGQDAVSGVESLSADAARALDDIVQSAHGVTDRARRIAAAAQVQEQAVGRLTGQMASIAAVSSRALGESNVMAERAVEAAGGHAELEHAMTELQGVADRLQGIARHFASGDL
ncbi:MAG: methyl-accepting chemotaxis protein [Gemmatimonadales bacterium]